MKNRIRILATSDIHGYIYPYHYSDHSPADRGTAKLKTALDTFRDEQTILVDNGDSIQGSSLQFFHYTVYPKEPSPITRSFNAIGYDYANLGNHDFDFGEEALLAHIDTLNCPLITNNVILRGNPLCANYVIREIGGKKIALFGVVTHFVKNWQNKKNLKHFSFRDAFTSAEKTVELIKRLERPDYIIGLYHGGFERNINTGLANDDELNGENQAYRMVKEINGLDVLICGHTHTTLAGTAYGTAYAQPGKNGQSFACIDIYTDTGVIEPRVIPVDTEADEELMKLTEHEEHECQDWLDTPLGRCAMDLSIQDQTEARLHKSQVVTFINRIMLEASGADLSSTPLFNNAAGFRPEVTMRDLVNTYRFANTLVVKKISGKTLREYLEKTARFWSIDQERIVINPQYLLPKEKLYYYDMLDGADYTITVSNDPGSRITSLTYHGEKVTDDMEFLICINSFRASGGANYRMLRDAPTIREIQTGMVELIALWVMEHQTIDFEPVNNITVRK